MCAGNFEKLRVDTDYWRVLGERSTASGFGEECQNAQELLAACDRESNLPLMVFNRALFMPGCLL